MVFGDGAAGGAGPGWVGPDWIGLEWILADMRAHGWLDKADIARLDMPGRRENAVT
ncbi:hypothetical protein HUK84_13520 [Nguyenibacter vanlangensis]|uniref:Uncharacterized protein n=2 Tax=Nguyenibacter vanlangensis TaxID=1216886 RepID=A0A7Y7M6J6_9PROT|nr:hypothetical protein [Nguyenibacter vanlangensis]